ARVTVKREEEPGRITTTWSTPDGDLTSIEAVDGTTNTTHPIKYFVENAEDLKAARWFFTDNEYSVTPENAEATKERQKTIVEAEQVSNAGIGPGPFMNLIEHVMGPENTVYLLMDEREAVEELLALMHEDRIKELTALLPHTKSDTFWMTENTTTSLLSPDLFRRYCMRDLTAYGNLILEHDVIPVHHMCGTLNAILEDIDTLPAMVNEAYTTGPLGDVTLAEGKTRMPSKALMGGTNATLWMSDAETIIETVAEDLATCPDHLGIFLTSAGVLPPDPTVTVEKAKTVVEAFQNFAMKS
ncbi:MAG: uroporphyrinogen decarboxylase family protein, partial [Planctomycetota bacterium]